MNSLRKRERKETDFSRLTLVEKPEHLAPKKWHQDSVFLKGVIRSDSTYLHPGQVIAPVQDLVLWFEHSMVEQPLFTQPFPIIHSSLTQEKSKELFSLGIIQFDDRQDGEQEEQETKSRWRRVVLVSPPSVSESKTKTTCTHQVDSPKTSDDAFPPVVDQQRRRLIGHCNMDDPKGHVFLAGDSCSVWFETSQEEISLRSYRCIMTGRAEPRPWVEFILERIERTPLPPTISNANQWCQFRQTTKLPPAEHLPRGRLHSNREIRQDPKLLDLYQVCSQRELMTAIQQFHRPFSPSDREHLVWYLRLRPTFFRRKARLYFNLRLISSPGLREQK